MSVAAAPAGPEVQAETPAQPAEGCPLCGSALGPDQEWCLRCGAAARTRLASTPNWRAPLVALGLTIVLGLGVLTAALVSLAGGSGSAPGTTITRTVTAPASTPGATTPGAGTPGATTPGTTVPGATTPGATVPGATTTPGLGTTTTPGARTVTTPSGQTITVPAGKTIPSLLLPQRKK